MTHPVHEAKGNPSKRRVKGGEPFDPEELTRRLTAHLVEQKAKSDRRRAERAAKEAAQHNEVYHHVPKVAAAAFQRTTTPDVMRQIHQLSQPALKQHLEVLNPEDLSCEVTNLQRTQALDQAVVERDRLRNRNQFQWDHSMEEAAEVDLDRDVFKAPTRTFSEFAHLRSRHSGSIVPRPLSTGDVLSEEDEIPVPTRTKPKLAFDGRNDWAQLDNEGERKRTMMERASPFLRKRDSIWILKSRKEKHGKHDKDEAVAGIEDFNSPPDSSKSRKNSFLARFKRHPS